MTPEGFWGRVVKTQSCWLWTGAMTGGYGQVRFAGGFIRAHRLAYELTNGQIPDGLDLDHLCRVTNCVNPAHLEPVTRPVNILRGVGMSAKRARQTHCKRGHEFTPENTYKWRTSRICRACARQRKSRAS